VLIYALPLVIQMLATGLPRWRFEPRLTKRGRFIFETAVSALLLFCIVTIRCVATSHFIYFQFLGPPPTPLGLAWQDSLPFKPFRTRRLEMPPAFVILRLLKLSESIAKLGQTLTYRRAWRRIRRVLYPVPMAQLLAKIDRERLVALREKYGSLPPTVPALWRH